MAASPSPGSRSPLRLGGIALIGVGVIAALAGLITTTQSGSNGTVAQAPTASSAVLEASTPAAPPSESVLAAPPSEQPGATASFVPGPAGDGTAVGAPPSAPLEQPVPAEPAVPAPAVAAPPPAPAGAGQEQGGGSSSVVAGGPLRVYNNSKIQGLAARAAGDFRDAGWTVSEIGGYPGATIPTSTVYYRPGTGEQATAQEIGRSFGLRVEPRFSGIQGASPGVIVIVTREYQSPGKS